MNVLLPCHARGGAGVRRRPLRVNATSACSPRRIAAFALAAVVALPTSVLAFPPYRSTDADTSPTGVLEARLGLLRVEREGDDNQYIAPLFRLNLGVADNAELVSEFEYSRNEHQLGDGAVGLKVVARRETLNVGVETLALLPVSSAQSGVGVESQFLATLRPAPFRIHLNVGGSYDPRANETERGWRASILTEVERPRARLGVELFARRFRHRPVEVQVGAGVIFTLACVSVRAGLHAGLTSEASDVTATLWLSADRKLW